MIEEKNKTMNKTMTNKTQKQLTNTIAKKDFMSTANFYKENPLFKVTRSLESDMSNFLKETEEANAMLSENFTIERDPKNKGKEKDSLAALCRCTIQRAKQNEII